MSEADLDKAARFEAEARDLHRRSWSARTRPGSIILRFMALWKEEAARLLKQRCRSAAGDSAV
ncbi:hypothetical protein [Brevundimonas sanguinis]|uniref:hypothetical protein n=1 Tax=Brevundimonas sanguinis TaxID=3021811 RepID=UPI00241505E7|nr:hypothetical protein [Brevundimonas sp. NCCP 15609]